MQAIKDSLSKVKNKLVEFGTWVADKYRNNRKKCKGTLLGLALLAILAGLIMGSFKSVDSLSQGAVINYTDNTLQQGSKTNYGSFLGLNSAYQTLPATNFLISFEPNPTTKHSFPPLKARVMEGTLLELDVHAKVRVSTNDFKKFFENYGFEMIGGHQAWLVYVKEKIKNVVIQKTAAFRFYEVSNQALSKAINNQFTTYETNSSLSFPFIVRIIAINIHYPAESLQSRQTLGIRLLEEKSLLSQLTSQLTQVQGYVQQYQGSTTSYAQKRGQLEGSMASREAATKLASNSWSRGIQVFSNSVGHNQTLLQKYLEVYFNSLYNATYRIESLQPFQI